MSSIIDFTAKEFAKLNPQNGNGNENGHKKGLKPLLCKRMSEVVPRPVEWLWDGLVPLGMFTLLQGEEGLGKSWICYALAACVAAGGSLPFSASRVTQGNVLILTTEDSDEYQIKPRLASLEADDERIYHVSESFSLSDSDGVLRLAMLMEEIKPRLVILDPVTSYTRGNTNDEFVVRPVLESLNRLAQTHRCAIIGIQHLNKSKGGGDVRKAGMGAGAFRNVARSVLIAGKDPDNERTRAVCQTKSNVGPVSERSIGFQIDAHTLSINGIEFETGKFFWTGESSLTASKMLSSPAMNDEDAALKSDAVAFLRETLRDGEQHSVTDLFLEGKALGFKDHQLRYAANKLGVKSQKQGGWFGTKLGQNWSWSLPQALIEKAAEDDKMWEVSHLQQNVPQQRTYRLNRAEDNKPSRVSEENSHLQPNGDNKSFKTDGLTEDEKTAQNSHLQQPTGGKLFPDKPPAANGRLLREHEKPISSTYECNACGRRIPIAANDCPHCGERQFEF
jgi:hypothetical protein